MRSHYMVVGLFVWAWSIVGTGIVSAQNYPNKPLRIVTASVGGGADVLSRIIAAEISETLGQPVVIENRASGEVPFLVVAHAPPDGYTMLVNANSTWNTTLVKKVSYDPVKEYAPVSIATRSPSVVVVHPSLPVKSVKDLIAMAQASPGKLNSSTGSTGGAGHLALELFKSMAGVNIVRVPYSSSSQETADLLSGRVQMTIGTGVEMSPLIKSGKMKALAVTSAQPSVLFPDLPTVAASGVPGYEWATMFVVFVPANTPGPIITRLNREIVTGLNKPVEKQKLLDFGSEVVGSSPEQMGATMKAEMARVGKVVKEAGIWVE